MYVVAPHNLKYSFNPNILHHSSFPLRQMPTSCTMRCPSRGPRIPSTQPLFTPQTNENQRSKTIWRASYLGWYVITKFKQSALSTHPHIKSHKHTHSAGVLRRLARVKTHRAESNNSIPPLGPAQRARCWCCWPIDRRASSYIKSSLT